MQHLTSGCTGTPLRGAGEPQRYPVSCLAVKGKRGREAALQTEVLHKKLPHRLNDDPGSSRRLNELPRSKLRGIRTNRESLAQLSPPHVSGWGPVLSSPGFPLKACGNDGLRKGNKFYAASCGELDPVEIKAAGKMLFVSGQEMGCPTGNRFLRSLLEGLGRDGHCVSLRII